MLFVEHDQRQALQGKEDGRAGANRQQWPAAGAGLQAAAPRRHPLRRTHAAVVLENVRAQPFAGPVEQLGDEPDLRRQQQDAPARGQLRRSGLQVDLGLAGARHPPEQQGLPVGGGADGLHRCRLLQAQGRGGDRGFVATAWVAARQGLAHREPPQPTAPLQGAHQVSAEAALRQQIPQQGAVVAGLQPVQQLPLTRAEALRGLGGIVVPLDPHQGPASRARGSAPTLTEPAGRQGALEGAEAAGVAGISDAIHQGLPGGIHGRRLQHGPDRLDPCFRKVGWRQGSPADHQARMAATLQRYLHEIAGAHGLALWVGVGEDLPLASGLQPDIQPGGREGAGRGGGGIRGVCRQSCVRLPPFLR